MDRPGASVLISIAVHAVVVGGVMLALLLSPPRAPLDMRNAVPVSIVSEMVTVEAGPADAPTEDAEVAAESATAPPPTAPEPPPPPVEVPVPTPRPPTPPPAPRPNAQPKRPPPPPSQPPPSKQRETRPPADELCLTCIAGERTDQPNPRARNNQPPAGQQGRGTAPRAIGQASLQALANQIYEHWDLPCNLPGGRDAVIAVRLTLDENGRLVGRPRARHSNQAIADGVERAIRAAAPFRMPSGYEQQEIPFEFRTATMCSR